MKITVQRETLLPALQMVNGAIERRQSLPILGNVLMVLENGRLTLTGTDMEVEIVAAVPLEASEGFAVTAPARKLLDIVRALPPQASMELSVGESQVGLKSGRSRFALATMPAADFPNIGDFEPALEFSVGADELKSLIGDTQFAMAHQDVRYYLNGLLLEMGGPKLRAVATDGHRLAMAELDVAAPFADTRQVIVPRKGIGELGRLLDDSEEKVTIGLTDNHLRVSVDDKKLTTKLIEGKFPDYERVIPVAGEKVVLADRELLKQGLSRAAILSNEKFRGIRLILGDKTLKAVAHNPEQEEAEEEMEVEYEGEALEIGFNVSYLLDVLNTVTDAKIRIALSDGASSCLLTPEMEGGRKYVVMPMRL